MINTKYAERGVKLFFVLICADEWVYNPPELNQPMSIANW
jgi:hypothetical protein